MTDREAFNEFARGIVFALGIVGVFIMFVAFLPQSDPPETFEVVDKYKGCDVVRYTTKSNNWEYFLDCTDRN